MMPAEFMLAAVTMLADAVSQLLDFLDELFPRHCFKILVHDVPPELPSNGLDKLRPNASLKRPGQ